MKSDPSVTTYESAAGGTQEPKALPKMLGETPLVHPGAEIRDSRIGAWTEIGSGWCIHESSIGDYSYLAGTDGSVQYSSIGRFCSIASHVAINPGDHPMDRVTQHHFTYRSRQYGFAPTDDASFFEWRRKRGCTIGHDVWIGNGAMLMAGVKVGNGAVIGSNAVVTHDVAPYEIVAGVPARHIRFRFPENTIERLQYSCWWDWDRSTLEARFRDFSDLPSFLEKYA